MTISRHDITATIDGNAISIIDISVTLDESWSPYAQASLTASIPSDAISDLLDPRESPRVALAVTKSFGQASKIYDISNAYIGDQIADFSTVWAGKTIREVSNFYYRAYNPFGLRSAETRNLNLTVRERVIDYVSSTMSLTLSSDEALLQDYALVANSPYTPSSTSVRAIAEYVLNLIGADLEAGTADATITADARIWEPGQTAWDYLEPLVQAGSLRLFCDELQRWYLVPDTYDTPGSVNLSYLESLTDAQDTISRDSERWYDAVVIKYEYVDGAGNTVIAYDSAGVTGFSKVLTLTYDTAYPGAGAAARVLARANGRGRVNDISAVSDYTVTPGVSCSLTMPNADTQIGNVAAVTWTLPDDKMSIKTRGLIEVPSTAWIFTASGIAWEDIATGVHWNTYTA